jgi:hypothetical protein
VNQVQLRKDFNIYQIGFEDLDDSEKVSFKNERQRIKTGKKMKFVFDEEFFRNYFQEKNRWKKQQEQFLRYC